MMCSSPTLSREKKKYDSEKQLDQEIETSTSTCLVVYDMHLKHTSNDILWKQDNRENREDIAHR